MITTAQSSPPTCPAVGIGQQIGLPPYSHLPQPAKILHLLDSLQIGGTEGQCLNLARGLLARGIENRLVCFNQTGPLLERFLDAGIPVTVLSFRGLRHPAMLSDLFRLASFLKRQHISVVQAYGFYTNVPGLLAGCLARVPVLVASRRDMGEFLSAGQRRIERTILRLAHRVVVNAVAIRNDLVASGHVNADKVTIIQNGVDLAAFDRAAQSGPPRQEIPWSAAEKIVAMVAKFREQKDHLTLLRAARAVLDHDSRVAFLLAGGVYPGSPISERLYWDAKRESEELGIARAVHFLGPVAPADIPAFLGHVDISVLASRGNEGIPNVLLESMAAGKPVVSTDTGGCREVIQDGVTGYLVPVGDARRLAETLIRLLSKDPERSEMGRAARARVEREFSLGCMVDRFEALYATLLPAVHRPTSPACG